MNVQRLKFAYARGARIQFDRRLEVIKGWQTASAPSFGSACIWRIHPDDAHLEYGYLSQSLREAALYNKAEFADCWDAALALVQHYYPPYFIALTKDDGYLLRCFWLDFAEMLADEGL